jgi:hypothetical protein
MPVATRSTQRRSVKFIRGLFSLRTRRFGTIAEILVRNLIGAEPSRSKYFDLRANDQRVEVKFSLVLRKNDAVIDAGDIVLAVIDAGRAPPLEERSFPFAEWRQHRFSCSINQIKPAEADEFYYCLAFSDCVVLFKAPSEAFRRPAGTDEGVAATIPNYCARQHKNSVGEGQFDINARNLQYHMDSFLFQSLTYPEVIQLLSCRQRSSGETRSHVRKKGSS